MISGGMRKSKFFCCEKFGSELENVLKIITILDTLFFVV